MEKSTRVLLFLIVFVLFLIPVINASIFDNSFIKWLSGKATQSASANITVGGIAPIIFNVSIIGATQSITEGGLTNVTFYFRVLDIDGTGDLNDATARGAFNSSGEVTRRNDTCAPVGNINSTVREYVCRVGLYWFDGAGAWNINASIADNNNLGITNTSANFTLSLTTAFSIGPSALTWATLNTSSLNETSNNDPMLLNNTGNKNITTPSIQVTVINLIGETNASQYLNASNFTVDLDTGGSNIECLTNASTGATMINNTAVNITGSLMPRGNFTRNFGNETSSQEQLYYCLTAVSTTAVNPQSYSTNVGGTWTVTAA